MRERGTVLLAALLLVGCWSVEGGVGWALPIPRHPPHSNNREAPKVLSCQDAEEP